MRSAPTRSGAISPADIRLELERLVLGDLHGPGDGGSEILPESPTPRDRYLLGALAPRNERVLANEFDSATSGTDSGSPTEDRIAPPSRMPTSIGLTFSVPPATQALAVTARWATYRKGKRIGSDLVGRIGFEDVEPEEEPTVWVREAHEGTLIVALDAERIAPASPDPAHERIVIRGRVRRTADASLVTLFIINDQTMPAQNVDEAWLFQVSLEVADLDGAEIFLERTAALPIDKLETDGVDERSSLRMLYRKHLDFAVGCGTAVEADRGRSLERAVRLRTVNAPSFEVLRVEAPPPKADTPLATLELDMKVLAHANASDLTNMLRPLASAYRDWIGQREQQAATDPDLASFRESAKRHLDLAKRTAARIEAGVALLASDPDAAEAFRFANDAMWRQRVRTLAVLERREASDPAKFDIEAAARRHDTPRNHSWRVFQLAFILINLPALVDPSHVERGEEAGLVDLLFFPTGGGKTEAYLGLAAFVFAIRRLQGTLASDDGPLDGRGGVAVLMRYTLRLLTAQQFQRAAALVCAAEVIRRERVVADSRWGTTPIRLGLYIGGAATPNSVNEAFSAIETARQRAGRTGGYADPLKLEFCPWCGSALTLARDVRLEAMRARVFFECPDITAGCPFTPRHSAGEGIPVVTTDEEIYRLLPDFLIATVDKLAQLPWKGALHTLFGRVSRRCERHGYRSADLVRVGRKDEGDAHNAADGCPAARTVPCDRLRPPDLIVQDELHLISGPLGTLVGLYEAAVDRLASVSIASRTVRPKVIASTATIRRAERQVREVFARDLSIFPPSGLDADDNFFAVARPVGEAAGRRYVGICARGQRMKAIEARIAIAVLAAAQKLFDAYGEAVDPYMTMLTYFNSVRELAGMRRLLDDDVRTRLSKATQRGLGLRSSFLHIRELTSRIGSGEILEVLDLLGVRFEAKKKDVKRARPVDAVLATNMISVGVDVPRLGLMVVAGQPKSTAEYIQATSRVGRDAAGPGLIFTIYNWSRPRDLSHYERFSADHATFYRQVEALSVTPFAKRALDRGLTAVLVALVRHESAHRALGERTNPNAAAQRVPIEDAAIVAVARYLGRRAMQASGDAAVAATVEGLARDRLDAWHVREARMLKESASLSYSREAPTLLNDGLSVPWNDWSAPNSLRDVERDVNLQLDRIDVSLAEAPPFRLSPASTPT